MTVTEYVPAGVLLPPPVLPPQALIPTAASANNTTGMQTASIERRLRLRQALVKAFVALDVIANPTGRVEIDCFKRSHKRPAQSDALTNSGVHIL